MSVSTLRQISTCVILYRSPVTPGSKAPVNAHHARTLLSFLGNDTYDAPDVYQERNHAGIPHKPPPPPHQQKNPAATPPSTSSTRSLPAGLTRGVPAPARAAPAAPPRSTASSAAACTAAAAPARAVARPPAQAGGPRPGARRPHHPTATPAPRPAPKTTTGLPRCAATASSRPSWTTWPIFAAPPSSPDCIATRPELRPPTPPTGGVSAAADRMSRHAVAAALAPWKQAIAVARGTHPAARAAARAARPHAPVRAGPSRDVGAAHNLMHQFAAPPTPPPPPAPTPAAGTGNGLAPTRHAKCHPRPSPAAAPPGTAKPARVSPRSTTPCTRPRTHPQQNLRSTTLCAPIPGAEKPAIPPGLPNRAAPPAMEASQRLKHAGAAAHALPTARG